MNACLRELAQLEIVKEATGNKRNRLYSYEEYTRIMNEESGSFLTIHRKTVS